MRSDNQSKALLVELLIVVLFFMLSATVLLQVFTTSRNQSARAGVLIDALNEAQNVADRLYTDRDAEAALAELGFIHQNGKWSREDKDYTITVTENDGAAPNGEMKRFAVQAIQNDEALLTLPVARYWEAQL